MVEGQPDSALSSPGHRLFARLGPPDFQNYLHLLIPASVYFVGSHHGPRLWCLGSSHAAASWAGAQYCLRSVYLSRGSRTLGGLQGPSPLWPRPCCFVHTSARATTQRQRGWQLRPEGPPLLGSMGSHTPSYSTPCMLLVLGGASMEATCRSRNTVLRHKSGRTLAKRGAVRAVITGLHDVYCLVIAHGGHWDRMLMREQ